MFQDEARFGRMVRIRRSWAPCPRRATVCNGYEREFIYIYGAISPIEGEFDWMTCRQMNAERMTEFLAQVSSAHARHFMLMVVDGASSHVSKDWWSLRISVCYACRRTHQNSTHSVAAGTKLS